MRIRMTAPLFAWESLEDSASLVTIRDFMSAVPDERLLSSLRAWRGRGRDDYPIHVLWGTCLLTVLLRHATTEACLGELSRNAALRRLIGIESESGVPKAWNLSRFHEVLGREPHRSLLREVFDTMVSRLADAVGDLGERVAGDASALQGRRGRGKDARGELPGPAGGRKEYTDDSGHVTKVVEWFGYKFHLLVDVRHEVILSYRITPANVADKTVLGDLVADAKQVLPTATDTSTATDASTAEARGRMRSLAYDKAADSGDIHALLDAEGIAPIIENRSLWTDERERMLPGHDGNSNVVYDEAGTVYCYDVVSKTPVRRKMSYIGHEPSRGTLKYRCPARHEGFTCPSHDRCNAGKKYGKTVRVKREIDLRRFPPIPRATKQFERLYKGRSAVERVNARIKIFWGADDGNTTGPKRFHAKLGTVMVVHIGLATLLASCPRREGTLGKMRLGPIAKALQEKIHA